MPATISEIKQHIRRCKDITKYVKYLNADASDELLDDLETYLKKKDLWVIQKDMMISAYPVYITCLSESELYELSDFIALEEANMGASKKFLINGKEVDLNDIKIPDILTTKRYVDTMTKFMKNNLSDEDLKKLEPEAPEKEKVNIPAKTEPQQSDEQPTSMNVEAIKIAIKHNQTPTIANLCDALLIVLPRPQNDATRAMFIHCFLGTASYYTDKKNHAIISEFASKLTEDQRAELKKQPNSAYFTEVTSQRMQPAGQVPPKPEPMPQAAPAAPKPVVAVNKSQEPPSYYPQISPNPAPRELDYKKAIIEQAVPTRAVRQSDDSMPVYKIALMGDKDIGVDFKEKTSAIPGQPNTAVKLNLWDAIADERFHGYSGRNPYQGVDGVIITLDLTDQESFSRIMAWVTQIKQFIFTQVPIILVGCKSDDKNRVISKDDAMEFVRKFPFPYFETSAKMNYGFEKALDKMAEEIYSQKHPKPINPVSQKSNEDKLLSFSVAPKPVVAAKKASQVPPSPYPHLHPNPAPRNIDNNRVILEPAAPNREVNQPKVDDSMPVYKILLVGDHGTGKSCLLLRYTDGCFSEGFIGSIGVDFKVRTSTIPSQPNTAVKLKLWDTASVDNRFYDYRKNYRGVDGVIIAFDLTDKESFNSVKNWVTEVQRCAYDKTPIILVGCKSDLEDRAVSKEEAQEFADKLSFPYVETSAKMDYHIEKAFEKVAEEIYYKNHPEKEKLVIVEPIDPVSQMIAEFRENKQLSFSGFDIEAFNALTHKIKPEQVDREKIRASLLSSFSEKTTQLTNSVNVGTSQSLAKLIHELSVLKKIKSTLSIIQPGLFSYTLMNKQTTSMNQIDQLSASMMEKANAVTENLPIAKFNLALLKFKLIDYTSLEKLDPKPNHLLGYLAIAVKGIEGMVKMKPTEPAQFYTELPLHIQREITLMENGKLSKDQRAVLEQIKTQAISCHQIAQEIFPKLPKEYTVADALKDVRAGAASNPLPQHRHRR